MTLTRLKSPDAASRWLREWTTGQLRTDSRELEAGDAFIAWPGYSTDGRRFVGPALAAGAATCLVEAEGVEAFGFDNARVGALPALKAATGVIADTWFEQPSAALDVVAVTGTNGKTSTAWWTAQALSQLGRRCGVVGTLGIGEPPQGDVPAQLQFTGLTTPDPVRLHGAFRRMADEGFAACAIEASSIGIVEQRLAGVRVGVALFTNFTRDHLDYHGSMEAYWQAKEQLFASPTLRAAVVNVDDEKGAELAASLAVRGVAAWTCSTRADARLAARNIDYADGGLAFDLHEGAETARVQSRLIGDYNVSNLLVVIGGLRALGVSLVDAAACCAELTPVPGRMQRIGTDLNAPQVVVDYAHTPDALDKVLAALQPLAAARRGKLVAVFGCGGNRDASKRPLMAAIAQARADRVIATSDNPRHESPAAILEQVAAGFVGRSQVSIIEDRREAIASAIADAAAADVVVIAGKGHEDYQDIAGVKHPFSDANEAEAALRGRA